MTLRKLRMQRTATLQLSAFACIVSGLWTLAAVLFGAGVGAAVGLLAIGAALLVVEGLS